MKHYMKIFLTLLAMTLSSLTAQAQFVARIGTTNYETLQAALNAATDHDVIDVLTDISEPTTSKEYSGNHNHTLNLNGNDVEIDDIGGLNNMVINGPGSLTLDALKNPCVSLDHTLTINGATVVCKELHWYAQHIVIEGGADVTVNSLVYFGDNDGNFTFTIDDIASIVRLKNCTVGGYNNASIISQLRQWVSPAQYSYYDTQTGNSQPVTLDLRKTWGLTLTHTFGANATVTFWDAGTTEPVAATFDPTTCTASTAITSCNNTAYTEDHYFIVHVVPAVGYWTDQQLRMAFESGTSLARSRSLDFDDLPRSVTLLKRDTYTDAAGTHDRLDGAGWYCYTLPKDHKIPTYTSSVIDGEVVRKFDLSTDNTANISQSGKVVTITHGTADAWTAEVSFNAVEFPFTGETIGPEITGVKIKNGGTTMLEMTAAEAAQHLRKPMEYSNLIHDGIPILTNATSDYTCFLHSEYGDDVFFGDATYAIIVPFEGSGTSASPWKIQTPADLVMLGKCVNIGGCEFPNRYLVQTANLDMSGATGFEPIGILDPADDSYKFCGSYDGKGYTISNINYTNSTPASDPSKYAAIGLFGSLGTDDFAASVSNVTLIDCTFAATATSGVVPAGAIAGEIERGTVSGCTVKGNSSVSALTAGSQTGAIVGFAGVNSTLKNNYYTFDVTVSNSAATREDYALRGTWNQSDEDPDLSTWTDLNDANEGAMLLVKKATVPAENANSSKVTFNEVTKGTDRYDRTGDDFYYAVGQPVTLTVTTGEYFDGDIRTFQDQLTALTVNGTDITSTLKFTMPEVDAEVSATFTLSDWFTIDTNQKQWMSFYHVWKDANGAEANYDVTDASGTGKTIKAKSVGSFDLKTGAVTPVDLSNVSYNGVPTLFHCETATETLPEKLKFTPKTGSQSAPTYDHRIKGVSVDTKLTGAHVYIFNGLGEFIRAYLTGATDTEKTLKAHRCYVDLDANPTSLARLYILMGDDDATGIQTPTLEGAGSGAAWYTIDGRKLEGQPTKKGLYINGGRKVVIK